jgi:hypothetical protein
VKNFLCRITLSVCIVFAANASFTADQGHQSEDTSCEANSMCGDVYDYVCKLVNKDDLYPTAAKRVSVGLVLLFIGVYYPDALADYTNILAASGIFLLMNGVNKSVTEYYDNFDQEPKKFKNKKVKRRNKPRAINYREMRIRFGNCLSAAINTVSNGYLLYTTSSAALEMIEQGSNPLFDSFSGDCNGYFCVSAHSPIILVVAAGGLAYNVVEFINNIRNQDVYEQNIPVFDCVNGIALAYLQVVPRVAPWGCEQMPTGVELTKYVLQNLGDPEKLTMLNKSISRCQQTSMASYTAFRCKGAYANSLIFFGACKLANNLGEGAYRYWRGRQTVKQFLDAKEEIFPLPVRLENIPDCDEHLADNLSDDDGRHYPIACTPQIAVQAARPLDAAKKKPVPVIIQETAQGNYKKPKKPKYRQKIATTHPNNKHEKIELDDSDRARIELIKQIFEANESKEISRKAIKALADDAAKLLKGTRRVENNRCVILWNNGQRSSFEMAHKPSDFQGFKKTKAIKAIVQALIFDVDKNKLSLYENSINAENTPWRLAMSSLSRR